MKSLRELNNNIETFKSDISSINDQIINEVKNDRPFHVSIKDYDIPQTNDITHILKEINDTASALGANIFIPSDKLYIISEEVIFTKPIVLFSDRIPYRHNLSSNTFGIGTTNNGCLIFRGNGCAIECLNVIGLEGNTNDGVRFEGGRPIIRDLSVSMHGGNGLVVGWNSDDTPPVNININGFIIDNITSKDNAGYGCVIADTTGGNNANAGIFTTCDIMYNDAGGLLLKNAHANVLLGLHIESNSGYGIKCEHAGGNCFIRPYIESSGLEDFYLDSDSNGNIVLGTRAGSGGVTEDGKNYLIGVIKGTDPLPHISEFVTNGVYTACDLAGRWRAYSPANRNLNLELSNTSADGYVNVCHSDPSVKVGLRINDGAIIKRIEEHGKTVNFGTIYRHSTKDIITDILGVHPSCITLTPSTTLPSGLFWCAYLNEDGQVVLRMANITDSDVVVNTSLTITVIS